MNILILNWRDIKNPRGGGAEILTHEMAKRWVRAGHQVTQFSERFDGSLKEEIIDGIKVIRGGSADIRSFGIPVHIAACYWYLRSKKQDFNVVLDEIHGIPFFSPWYVRAKKVALICEVAKDLWDVAFPFPANFIGSVVEKNYFHFYKHIPFLTISPSTKTELFQMGVEKEHVTVIPMGLSVPKKIPLHSKEKNPTLIFVARLTKAKGIEKAIQVLAKLKQEYPNIHLWVVGQGEKTYMQKVKEMVNRNKLRESVIFFGFVNQSKKFELMSKAHILIVPSVKEGWGLTVPEAGYVGTPSVAFDVEGLRDVIRHKETGLLTEASTDAMSKGVLTLLGDKKLYRRLQIGARKLAHSYSWDQTANVALSVMKEISL